MSRQLVFIDESGDPGFNVLGGASPYFAIGLVIFNSTNDTNAMIEGINTLKNNLNIRGELKFSKSSHDFRSFYIQEINKHNFYSKVIVVDKKLIKSQDLRTKPRLFYNFILKQILLHSPIENAKAVLDGKGNKHFIQELKAYLKRGDNKKIKDFSLSDSKKDTLVQVADTITSAIAWGYKNNKHIYKNMFDKEKINIWEFK